MAGTEIWYVIDSRHGIRHDCEICLFAQWNARKNGITCPRRRGYIVPALSKPCKDWRLRRGEHVIQSETGRIWHT